MTSATQAVKHYALTVGTPFEGTEYAAEAPPWSADGEAHEDETLSRTTPSMKATMQTGESKIIHTSWREHAEEQTPHESMWSCGTLCCLIFVTCSAAVSLVVLQNEITDFWGESESFKGCRPNTDLLRWPAGAISAVVSFSLGLYFVAAARHDDSARSRASGVEIEIEIGTMRDAAREAHTIATDTRTNRGMSGNPQLGLVFGLATTYHGVGSFLYHACGGCHFGQSALVMSVFALMTMLVFIIMYEICSIYDKTPGESGAVGRGRWILQSTERIKVRLLSILWCCLLPLWAFWDSILWLGSRKSMIILLLVGIAVVLTLLCLFGGLLCQAEITTWAKVFLPPGCLALVVAATIGTPIVADPCREDDGRMAVFQISLAVVLFCLHGFFRTLNQASTQHWLQTLLLVEPWRPPATH